MTTDLIEVEAAREVAAESGNREGAVSRSGRRWRSDAQEEGSRSGRRWRSGALRHSGGRPMLETHVATVKKRRRRLRRDALGCREEGEKEAAARCGGG